MKSTSRDQQHESFTTLAVTVHLVAFAEMSDDTRKLDFTIQDGRIYMPAAEWR